MNIAVGQKASFHAVGIQQRKFHWILSSSAPRLLFFFVGLWHEGGILQAPSPTPFHRTSFRCITSFFLGSIGPSVCSIFLLFYQYLRTPCCGPLGAPPPPPLVVEAAAPSAGEGPAPTIFHLSGQCNIWALWFKMPIFLLFNRMVRF